VCPQRRDGTIRAAWMEKIMINITCNTEREFAASNALTESELDNISGGEITSHSTNYTLTQTLCTWYNCLGHMGIGVASGA
jgi:hypothetical protein